MTAPESPAGLLRRAAERVRERSEAARARGPYFVEGRCLCYDDDEDWEGRCSHRTSSWRVRTKIPHDPNINSYQVTALNHEGDANWLATVSPQIARPLADWLDAAARSAGQSRTRAASTTNTDRAVAVARALLGESP